LLVLREKTWNSRASNGRGEDGPYQSKSGL
jgi:hypothetical protein